MPYFKIPYLEFTLWLICVFPWKNDSESEKGTILWLGNNKTVESSLEAQESMHFAPGFLSLNTGRFKVRDFTGVV